jgi:capsule polysaccharide export protein KpsE/RkpR
LRATVQQQVLSAELEIADAAEREKQDSPARQLETRKEAANARARLEEMRRQLQALDRQSTGREKLLAQRIARRDSLEADRKAAQAALAAVEGRLREARGDAGYRGERLKIIDPGILPERPSSPSFSLNVLAAMLLGLVLPITWFTLEMSYQEQRSRGRRSVMQPVARAGNE